MQQSAASLPCSHPTRELRYYKRPPLFSELVERLARPPLRAVVHGAPGLGKTALLKALEATASEVRRCVHVLIFEYLQMAACCARE